MGSRVMWRVVVIVLLALAGTAATARADDAPTFADHAGAPVDDVERHLGFLIDPASMAAGLFGAEIDWTLVRHVALSVEGGVFGLARGPAANVSLGLIVYPTADTFRGFYLAPHVAYDRAIEEPLVRWGAHGEAGAVGALSGWQWTWDYGLTVRVGVGAAKQLGADERASGPALAMGSRDLVLVTDASAGWLF